MSRKVQKEGKRRTGQERVMVDRDWCFFEDNDVPLLPMKVEKKVTFLKKQP